jgi:hypothetical protein
MLLARDLDNVEVYNAGVSGSDPVFEYRLFIDKLTQYQPDLLILTVNASDISDIKIRGGFERFQPDSTVRFNQGPWFEKYYAHSRLVRVLVHDIFRYDWQFISPAQQTSKNYQANNILCQAADSFSALSVIYGFKILLVFHPTMYEFKNRVPYEFTPLIRYCQMKEIPYVDVREAFIQSGIRPEDADKYYWPVDQHYNNAGYGRFSASIYKKVIGLLQ